MYSKKQFDSISARVILGALRHSRLEFVTVVMCMCVCMCGGVSRTYNLKLMAKNSSYVQIYLGDQNNPETLKDTSIAAE